MRHRWTPSRRPPGSAGGWPRRVDFAHRNGVLHLDIKPANILVDSYGRPMLADFNISSRRVGGEGQADEMFGGTFAYMAPEHLDAFNPDDDTQADAVTAQSDMYSLALVLRQMLEGRLAFALPDQTSRWRRFCGN